MEPVIMMDKRQPPASRFCTAQRFLSRTRTVLTPALTLALFIYARSSLPALLSQALAHTSKEAMFLFCNGILLFLAKGSTTAFVRPRRPCAEAADCYEGSRFTAGTSKNDGSVGGRQLAVPGMVVSVDLEAADVVATKVTAAVVGTEQEEQANGDALMEAEAGVICNEGIPLIEAEAGETYYEEIPEEVYVQLEDDVNGEDDCHLSTEELYKKAEEFIENFKRQRRFEAIQLVTAR